MGLKNSNFEPNDAIVEDGNYVEKIYSKWSKEVKADLSKCFMTIRKRRVERDLKVAKLIKAKEEKIDAKEDLKEINEEIAKDS